MNQDAFRGPIIRRYSQNWAFWFVLGYFSGCETTVSENNDQASLYVKGCLHCAARYSVLSQPALMKDLLVFSLEKVHLQKSLLVVISLKVIDVLFSFKANVRHRVSSLLIEHTGGSLWGQNQCVYAIVD